MTTDQVPASPSPRLDAVSEEAVALIEAQGVSPETIRQALRMVLVEATKIERELAEANERCAKVCDEEGAGLDKLIENAERSGPSHPRYVRDATWYRWLGSSTAYKNAAGLIRKLGEPK
jgi:hypothetical protein